MNQLDKIQNDVELMKTLLLELIGKGEPKAGVDKYRILRKKDRINEITQRRYKKKINEDRS